MRKCILRHMLAVLAAETFRDPHLLRGRLFLAGVEWDTEQELTAELIDSAGKITRIPLRGLPPVQAGEFILFAEDGVVKIWKDIDSLVTFTDEFGKPFRKNRVMRLISTIANDVYKQFSNGFIGVVNNNEEGRGRFKTAIVGYLLEIQDNQGIQNFTSDDVEVLPGTDIDAILVNIAIQPVDSVETIYMTVEVS